MHDPFLHLRLQNGIGRINPHSTGIRARIALAYPLVILRRHQRLHGIPVRQAEKADLFAQQKLFDHQLLLADTRFGPQQLSAEKPMRRFQRRPFGLTDHYAFARRKSVGLHHNGRMKELNRLFHFGQLVANRIIGGGNLVSLEKAFGKRLARLQHRRSLRRPKDLQSAELQCIHQPQRERQFRPDNCQVCLFGHGHLHHTVQVRKRNRHQARNLCDPAVTRRADYFRDPWALGDRPRQGMFAPTRSNDQNLHDFLYMAVDSQR